MTSSLKNLTINDTGHLQLPSGTTAQRPGTITTNIIQFTTGGATVLSGSATTTATSITIPAGVTSIDVLVVAGGGSGGGGNGGAGGGGAGGLIYRTGYAVTPNTTYNLSVGAGGASASPSTRGNNGSNSTFDTLTAIGGGGGGCWNGQVGKDGGSGGGGGCGNGGTTAGGAATLGQGNVGGGPTPIYSTYYYGSGGGGAGQPGFVGGGYLTAVSGNGGDGLPISISGTTTWYAGGGGGGGENVVPGFGGMGGGGRAGTPQSGTATAQGGGIGAWNGQAGTANTGSGGGAGGAYSGTGSTSGAGGSGVVIVRYYTSTNAVGQMRFNSSTQKTEVFDGIAWTPYTSTSVVSYNDAPTGTSVVSYSGPYKIHTYYQVGSTTFTPTTTGIVEVLVVAGGGSGGSNPIAGAGMAGGGAGGVLYNPAFQVIAGQSYTVTVGDGGAVAQDTTNYVPGNNGGNSVFGSLTAIGGGAGGGYRSTANPGPGGGGNVTAGNGGSGGGGGDVEPGLAYANGNPPGMGTAGQGNRGGYAIYNGSTWASAGGGGAWTVGGNATATNTPGSGGSAMESFITGQSKWYGPGGGGSWYNSSANVFPSGGNGGYAGGAIAGRGWIGHGEPGLVSGGGGGGGGGTNSVAGGWGGKGGSGIVIVKYLAHQPLISNVFTSGGTWTAPPGVYTVEVLAVGGGGAGGSNGSANNIAGGGGGGGGVVYSNTVNVTPGTTYSITVGAGGVASRTAGPSNGGNSTFGSIITAYGGGGGSGWNGTAYYGPGGGNGSVGSGGGGAYGSTTGGVATTGQGNNGGTGTSDATTYGYGPGGGGGAGGVGESYNTFSTTSGYIRSGSGGPGVMSGVAGYPTYYGAGGGAGSGYQGSKFQQGWGGSGVGGNGSSYGDGDAAIGYGNGGGGSGNNASSPYSNSIGGNGTAGLVAVRYKPGPASAVQPAGWRLPSTSFVRGSLTNSNLIWNRDNPPANGYASVVWNQVFTGDFTLVASFQHNYIGCGFVYGANIALTDFTGVSSDVVGPYFGTSTTTGFASASYLGQYHAPLVSGGASSQNTLYYFKWQRVTNTLTLQYATSATGPWTNFNSTYTTTISTGDKVICGIGVASTTQNSPLTFVSVSGY